jgi:hypothetical protein
MTATDHAHDGPNGDGTRGQHHPYWKSAHRDWRVWVAVCSMLAAMTIYVMSDNLAFRLRRQPPSATVAQ